MIPTERETFAELLTRLYASRYTGAVIVHFGEGVANEVHVLKADSRIKLAKAPKAHTASCSCGTCQRLAKDRHA